MNQRTAEIIANQEAYFKSHATKDIRFRIRQLKNLYSAIVKYEDKIYDALYKDLKKPRMESYTTEIGICLHEISHCIKNIKKWTRPERVRSPIFFLFSKSWIIREPFGRVLIISPWNYPFQLTINPLVGAISAGNCVVLKPSEISSHTAEVIEEMIGNCFKEEYVAVVQGGPDETQELLANRYDYIFFTGGESTAIIVMESASKNLTPVTLELGGKCPCIVDKDCDIDATARRITYGKFINAGQSCVAPDYVLVHRDVKEEFVEKIKNAIVGFYGAKPVESKDYARIINKRHYERLIGYLSEGRTLHGGETDANELFISPSILGDVDVNSAVMKDEIFGPILPVIEYDDTDEAIRFVNSRPKPLALYVFSNNRKLTNKILCETSSGNVCVNDAVIHVTSPYLPFGGVGTSGFGGYHGRTGFETFSHPKGVMKNTTLFEVPKRYPPSDNIGLKIMRMLLR